MIGMFVNTVALRSDLSGNPGFTELLQRVRDTCLGAFRHQDVPFGLLLEELRPPRDLTRTPVFQVLFNLLPLPGDRSQPTAGLVVETPSIDRLLAALDSQSKYDRRCRAGAIGRAPSDAGLQRRPLRGRAHDSVPGALHTTHRDRTARAG